MPRRLGYCPIVLSGQLTFLIASHGPGECSLWLTSLWSSSRLLSSAFVISTSRPSASGWRSPHDAFLLGTSLGVNLHLVPYRQHDFEVILPPVPSIEGPFRVERTLRYPVPITAKGAARRLAFRTEHFDRLFGSFTTMFPTAPHAFVVFSTSRVLTT